MRQSAFDSVARRAGPPPVSAGAIAVPRLWSALLGLAALAVYLLFCPPVSGDKDASEFTIVLALRAVPHPTGYPIFTLLGHAFVRLLHALGAGWPFAANAWSAVGGGVAIACMHALALQLVPPAVPLARRGRFLLALVPVALLAFNPMWTVETNLAEVYSWHLAWVMATAWVFVLRVRELVDSPSLVPAQQRRRALAWGLLCGLGGAHHLTAIYVAAPLSIALAGLAWRRRALRAGDALAVLVGACVPLLAYGFVAWRAFDPVPGQFPALAASWRGVYEHVSGTLYRRYLGQFDPSEEQRRYLALYIYPLLVPGLAVLLGVAWRARTVAARWTLRALALAALFAVTHAFLYGVGDPSPYFLTPLGLGLLALVPGLGGLWAGGRRSARIARAAVVGLALLATLVAVPWLQVARDRRQVYLNFETLVHRMWESIPFDRAIVLWPNDMYARLQEYQLLRGERLGLDVAHPIMLANAPQRAAFVQKYGFDPIGGIALRMGADGKIVGGADAIDAFAAAVEDRINANTSVPVILFDPEKQSVRLLKKPQP